MMASKTNSITITHEDLDKMRMRANLLPQSDPTEDKAAYLYQQSLQRTDQWADNVRDIKKRKEEERFRKFEKEELQRRRVDEEERVFQQKAKHSELQKANQKVFQDNDKVRAFNAQLLYSDTLKGRQLQQEVKGHLHEIDRKREQYYHQETLNQIQRQEEEDRATKEAEKKKLKEFQKGIKKQHKQVKKQYVQKYKQEMEEGQLLKMKAQAAIQAQEERVKERRARNMKNMEEVKEINNHNQELKAKQLEKEREEERKIQQYRKKQQIMNEMTKKQTQNIINQKILQREELYKLQADKLSKVKNVEVDRLNKQIEQMEKKQAELQRKKQAQNSKLKQEYEQSLKDQLAKRQQQKQDEKMENQKFKATWQSKLQDMKGREQEDERYRKHLNKKNTDDLDRQCEEKQRLREEQFRRELEEAERAKAAIETGENQFKSYAEKCMKEWEGNGKNLNPIVKQLTANMKQK